MAIEVELVAPLTPTVTPATDFSANQRKFIQISAGAIILADVRSTTTGNVGVLGNAPKSGENVTWFSAPNVPKVIAGEAIAAGAIVQPMSASGMAGVTSGGNPAKVGVAWTTAAGSGDLFACMLI